MMMQYKRRRWKYQLTAEFECMTGLRPPEPVATFYVALSTDGKLVLARGYAWDGASGPAIDTRSIMRGSLVHDALYQLIRIGELPRTWRKAADQALRQICIEDGMWRGRAAWVYAAVRLFGGRHV